MDIDAHQARDRAEAIFKKKEERLLDGQKAMAEYEAARLAMREKTERLRALRLARDALEKRRFPLHKSNRLDCSRIEMVQVRRGGELKLDTARSRRTPCVQSEHGAKAVHDWRTPLSDSDFHSWISTWRSAEWKAS